jgi:hypothetical protein
MDLNESGSWPMKDTYCYTLSSTTADPSVASSWKDQGSVLSESSFGWATQIKHLWAPDAFKGPDGKYYLYVPDVYNDAKTSRIGVAVSSTSPSSGFGVPSGLTNKTNYIENGSAYMSDPAVFLDPNDASGQYYLVFADGGFDDCSHISIAKLDPLKLTVSGTQKIQWANQSSIPNAGNCSPAYMEGPQLDYFGGPGFDGNGKYFLYFAMKDNTSVTESIAYATADKPMGPYTYQGIIMSGSGGTGWTNQASIVEWQGHYLFFYHNDPRGGTNPQRQVFLSCVGIKSGKIDKIDRNTFTSISACPKANTGMTATGGTGGTGSGGSSATGGKSGGGGGTSATGGKSGNGGSSATGGKSGGFGGTASAGGKSSSSTTIGNGGTTTVSSGTTGGTAASTSAAGVGGSSVTVDGTGGASVIGGTTVPAAGTSSIVNAVGGSTANATGTTTPSDDSSDGCGCRIATSTKNSNSTKAFGLLILGMLAFARRRRR